MESKFGEGMILVLFFIYLRFVLIFYFFMGMCMCLWRPKEGVEPPGPGVIGRCELSNMDASNRAWVLWESSKCS